MADMVNQADQAGNPPSLNNRTAILLEDDDRAESPTDLAMPMYRRQPNGQSQTSSPSQDQTTIVQSVSASQSAASSPDAQPTAQPSVTPALNNNSNADTVAALPAAAVPTATVPAVATAPILAAQSAPAVAASGAIFQANPANNPAVGFRLHDNLIAMAVPRLCDTRRRLFNEINIHEARVCKFMDDCNISREANGEIPWRKSMSHIFGRNKNCTRAIPENVWMWVCRKHYQRARYRNDHEYNIKLCRMVEIQVLRLEAWSNYNMDTGAIDDGIVVDWTLAVRRREQLRLNDETKSRKRKSPDEDDDDVDPAAAAEMDLSLVPQWILAVVGSGKPTLEIIRIVARIHSELEGGILTHFPDIEILPNITGTRAKPRQTRGGSGSGPGPDKKGRRVQQPKRQRSNESDHRAELPDDGSRGNVGDLQRFPPRGAPVPNHYGGAPNFQSMYPAPPPQPAHHRSASLGTNNYNQYAQQPVGYGGYGQNDYNTGSYFAAQASQPQNGYWTPDYDARQRRLQQANTSSYPPPNNGYMPPYDSGYQGVPSGPAPPVSAAKHSRNLSTPIRPTQPAMGNDRPAYPGSMYQSGYPSERDQRPRYDPASRYPAYTGLPIPGVNTGADSMGHAPAASTTGPRLALRGGPPGPSAPGSGPSASGPEGYEYPPISNPRP
ncbi:uncharacterized protein C8A04DRAFT_23846 [Dichotomopilus funicola]|uniref:Uncharacterized protein n=1 Tax=Dichotomopilus funicola TaxID=1934379 RepID=A0AAN6VAV0_9PEZI|nr:hypothetical protein C8A04DRAFT_23846 [Dichotomopilus funicola]